MRFPLRKALRWFSEGWIPILEKELLSEEEEIWYGTETQSINLNKWKNKDDVCRVPDFYVILHPAVALNKILSPWKEHIVGVSSAGGRILIMECEKKLSEHWKVNVSETGLLTIIGHLDYKIKKKEKAVQRL